MKEEEEDGGGREGERRDQLVQDLTADIADSSIITRKHGLLDCQQSPNYFTSYFELFSFVH